MGQLGKVGAKTHAELPDVSTPHLLADLEAAVCSETEADGKVAAAFVTDLEVSDVLRNSNDAERSVDSGSYVKLKEVLLNADLPACRIKFGLKSSDNTHNVSGRIYKNGIAIGTIRSTSSTTYQTYSEDFAGFVATDLIQIYAWNQTAGKFVLTNNMRFYYSENIATLGSNDLDTAILTTGDPTISTTNQDP